MSVNSKPMKASFNHNRHLKPNEIVAEVIFRCSETKEHHLTTPFSCVYQAKDYYNIFTKIFERYNSPNEAVLKQL